MLDLLNCPLTKLEGYRDKVFSMLPGLRSLDGLDQDGQEVEESDSEVEGQCNYLSLEIHVYCIITYTCTCTL